MVRHPEIIRCVRRWELRSDALIAKIFGVANFYDFLPWDDVKFGVLLTAIVNFVLIAASIYFVVVVPMNHMIGRRNARLGIKKAEAAVDPQIELLTQIRDSLQARVR